jgi:hypothetical protein
VPHYYPFISQRFENYETRTISWELLINVLITVSFLGISGQQIPAHANIRGYIQEKPHTYRYNESKFLKIFTTKTASQEKPYKSISVLPAVPSRFQFKETGRDSRYRS